MQERTLRLTDRVAAHLDRLAQEQETDASEIANFLIARAMQQSSWQPAIVRDRGQREGAHDDPRLDWWREAKFGLFIHWGLYAIPAGDWKGDTIPGIGEWIMQRAEIPVAEYEQLADAVQPGQVRRRRVGFAGQAGRAEVPRHHLQAPRRLLPLQVRRRPTTTSSTARPLAAMSLKELAEECAQAGHQARLLLLPDPGLAPSRRRRQRLGLRRGGQGFRRLHRELRQAPGARTADQLRSRRPHLVRHAQDASPRSRARSLLDLCNELQPDCLVCGRLGNALGDYASAGDNLIPERAGRRGLGDPGDDSTTPGAIAPTTTTGSRPRI